MVKKVIVAQLGARHRYAIPKALEEVGMLYRLYTSSTRYSFLGRTAAFLNRIGISNKETKRLVNRVPLLPQEKIYSSDLDFLAKIKYKIRNRDNYFFQSPDYFNSLSKKFNSWGTGKADCIYSMFFESIDFLRLAKEKGLKVVVDIFEAPNAFKELEKEISDHDSYKDLQSVRKQYAAAQKTRELYMEEVLKLADYYTIPSQFVQKSLEQYHNFSPSKVLFLPYPSSITTTEYNYRPQKYKLIWVGNDPVRKGLIYCAKAATILKTKYPDLDFRIIGDGTNVFETLPEFKDLHFVGRLNKEELMNEFQTAEAYVFPTLFEGFAGTVIEAASCGCPIITTEAAGTDTKNFPAIYIPTRDVEAIVSSVEKIFKDKNYRNQLSIQTYNYAKELRIDSYKNKLKEYFETI